MSLRYLRLFTYQHRTFVVQQLRWLAPCPCLNIDRQIYGEVRSAEVGHAQPQKRGPVLLRDSGPRLKMALHRCFEHGENIALQPI